MQVNERNIGLNFNLNQDAVVKVWAPLAEKVALQVEGREPILLQKDCYGYFSLITNGISAGERYWFLLDDDKQLPDPTSLAQPDGVHGASMAINLHYDWTDSSWLNPPLNDYLIYELHVGTFSTESDFSGIERHLDHLVDLGITAIELMPLGSFPGNRNWGYDGVFPYAVQHSYGGPKGLQQLVDACHKRGLAVILDVVYNHLGPEGNYLSEYGPYFTDKYHTPWGKAVNFDDQDCDGVREFVIENVLMWFRDFHIDALRLDAVHAIKDFSAVHVLQEIRQQTDRLMELTGRRHYLIAESDLNDPRYITSVAQQGMGMDAQWVDEFHHALRVSAGEARKGYYLDFNGLPDLAKSYRDAYVYTGNYSLERRRKFGKDASTHPAQQFIVFSQNHDQIGNRLLGERSSTLYSYEMQKLLAAAVLFSPYIPMLFMGEEWGETNPFYYFVSHTDKGLIEMVREGRKQEFAAMHAAGEAIDPQAEDTFNASRLNWDLLTDPNHQVLYQFYKKLISLRKSNSVLAANDRSAVKAQVLGSQQVLVLTRGLQNDTGQVICLMNFSEQPQQVSYPTGKTTDLYLMVDSASPQWHGPQASPEIWKQTQGITLQSASFVAYSTSHD
ncbi:maltooligosyltrehalose trehalohydrolase [Pedobacter sp. CAN_A7]|uniref:malto-oligosyltrehalose trehalohydrolase n=1 Tax=Pedobacter sp. CAN_A7 TaxID=2787722 RepID=UPI0018C9B869